MVLDVSQAGECHDGPGKIYIIQEDDNNYYKVGGTRTSAAKRISEMKAGNLRPLYEKEEFPTNNCHASENKAKNDLAQYNNNYWLKINIGGGTEWYMVPRYQFETFKNIVQNAANNPQLYYIDEEF